MNASQAAVADRRFRSESDQASHGDPSALRRSVEPVVTIIAPASLLRIEVSIWAIHRSARSTRGFNLDQKKTAPPVSPMKMPTISNRIRPHPHPGSLSRPIAPDSKASRIATRPDKMRNMPPCRRMPPQLGIQSIRMHAKIILPQVP